MRGEAIFGAVMAVMVLALAGFAVWSFEKDRFAGFDRYDGRYDDGTPERPYLASLSRADRPGDGLARAGDNLALAGDGQTDASTVCQCFDEAKTIAGEGVDAEPARYRTGLTQCRSLGGPTAAAAWTAGWNAALSSAPWDKTCLRFKARENLL